MREKIHFAHGNGFPASCYKQLLQVLESRFDCSYIDRIGHNPSFPVNENWDSLTDELIAGIRQQFSQPIIGVGHSFGGVLNFIAAIKEPSLFKAVIMIDSPLLGRFKSSMVRLAKSLGLIDRLTPAYRARQRKQHWQTHEELIAYLRSRPLFKTFSEECLQDYINFGFNKTNDGYQLHFDRYIEYLIFRTIPHHLPRYERQLIVPGALIYGDKSTVVDRFDVRNMKRKYHVHCYRMKGTHMLPMENPHGVAAQIFKVINDLSPNL